MRLNPSFRSFGEQIRRTLRKNYDDTFFGVVIVM